MQRKSRAVEIGEFLRKQAGLGRYEMTPMQVDASSRRYFRIAAAEQPAMILSDDEKRCNKSKEFALLSAFLLKNGIRAPRVYARNLRRGLMLVEDFGETDFVKTADGHNNFGLLRKAVDILVRLHQVRKIPAYVKPMSAQVIKDNFALFCDWYMPACLGHGLTDRQRAEFFELTGRLIPVLTRLPDTLVLWDYHLNNVMYPDKDGAAAVIDFQDALYGPGLYDLASLLEDERRNITSETVQKLKEYYFEQSELSDRKAFDEAYAAAALLRHMRVLGRFTTLICVSGKPAYAGYVPRAVELLRQSLENPLFKELHDWLEVNFAPANRGVPQHKSVSRAFVLAAGRGKRMRHLTDKCAKPMVRVGGRRLMDYGLDLLRHAGIKDIVVNVCYRKGAIKKHMAAQKDFKTVISEEKEALETGGGIKKALRHFGSEPFAVVNADNILIDDGYKPVVRQMIDVWDDEKHDILLLLCPVKNVFGDRPQTGDYKLAGDRAVRNREKVSGGGFDYGYVGVALIHPRIFAGAPKGKFSLVMLFDKAEAAGRLGYVISDRREFWVGSPEAVAETEKILAQGII